jgi:hypothetical protein
MVKQQLASILNKMSGKLVNNPVNRFNFDLSTPDGPDQFHLLLKNDQLSLVDGLHDTAIGLLKARERTVAILMDMGAELIESLVDLSFNTLPATSDLPSIEQRISIATELQGQPVNFNVFIRDNQVNILEENEVIGDIRIRIRSDYLPKLFNGKANLPMALLTGRIKIENKTELFKLLTRFGLKI